MTIKINLFILFQLFCIASCSTNGELIEHAHQVNIEICGIEESSRYREADCEVWHRVWHHKHFLHTYAEKRTRKACYEPKNASNAHAVLMNAMMRPITSGAVCGIEGIGSLYAYSGVLVCSLISIIGNIVVILAIVKYASLRKPPVSLFGVLSALHFLISCIIIPVNIKVTLQNTSICYDSFWWMFMIVSLTLATVAHITFDQYVRIYYLEDYIPSVKKLFAGLLGCYVPPFVFTFVGVQGMAGALVAIALFFLYICAIICSYVAMLVTLHNHRSILNTDARERCIDRERRSATNLMMVILLYIITHTPALLYIVFMLLGKHSPRLYIISMLTVGANGALNPVLYFVRMSTMRKYMLRLMGLERVNEKAKATVDDMTPPLQQRAKKREKDRLGNVPRSSSMEVTRQLEDDEEDVRAGTSLRRQNSAPPMRVRWETDV